MITFPYEEVYGHRGTFLRPKAVVVFHGATQSVSSECLIDSGADVTVVAWQFGQFLGWAPSSSEKPFPLGGISGNLPCYLRQAEMQIGEIRFEATVMWALSDDVPNLLGREDVFDRFDIEFRQRERKTIFRPV